MTYSNAIDHANRGYLIRPERYLYEINVESRDGVLVVQYAAHGSRHCKGRPFVPNSEEQNGEWQVLYRDGVNGPVR